MAKITANKIIKQKHPKRVHLSIPQIQHKVVHLEGRIKTLVGAENKNIRMRCFSELALLKKALTQPDTMVVDPEIKKEKGEKDKMRRIAKKMLKQKEIVAEKKADHNKKRRLNCLYCQKCEVISWTHYAGLQIQNRR